MKKVRHKIHFDVDPMRIISETCCPFGKTSGKIVIRVNSMACAECGHYVKQFALDSIICSNPDKMKED